jgi:DNA modification methylase
LLGMSEISVVRIEHLSDAEKRAYVLADNKLAENAGWDPEILAIELGELAVLLPEIDVDLDITITGFDFGEVDQIFADGATPPMPKGDEVEESIPDPPLRPVTRPGDLWRLGEHRVGCGDARETDDIDRLMQGDKAQMAFLDPPRDIPIHGHVQCRDTGQHEEFAFVPGETTEVEFVGSLREAMSQAARVSENGALHYACMDWRHFGDLFNTKNKCYSSLVDVCIWVKTNSEPGSPYGSQYECVFVFKVGESPHRNAVERGRQGRKRSNVWNYPGVAFKAGEPDGLGRHPAVKPVALVADAMRDCTVKGEIVLDTFLGSGTTLMAAERTGRRCRGLEYEPKYVDVAIKRWQAWTKLEAVCAGKTFDEIAAERAGAPRDEPSSTEKPLRTDISFDEHQAAAASDDR